MGSPESKELINKFAFRKYNSAKDYFNVGLLDLWKIQEKYYLVFEYVGNYASIRFNDLLQPIMVIQAMREMDSIALDSDIPSWLDSWIKQKNEVLDKIERSKRRIVHEEFLKEYLKESWTEIKSML
jgi:hypothetical protein